MTKVVFSFDDKSAKKLKNKKNILELYFAMARGYQKGRIDIKAMEMTKWFDTNYHYIVPEFKSNQKFKLTFFKIIDEFLEASLYQTKDILQFQYHYFHPFQSYALLKKLIH